FSPWDWRQHFDVRQREFHTPSPVSISEPQSHSDDLGNLTSDTARRAGITPANFADFQIRNRSFDQLAAYQAWNVNILGADRPEHVDAFRVTPGFFEVFGMKAAMGRTFSNDDFESGNDRVAVLSNGLWQARFGASPDVIGRAFSLGGRDY